MCRPKTTISKEPALWVGTVQHVCNTVDWITTCNTQIEPVFWPFFPSHQHAPHWCWTPGKGCLKRLDVLAKPCAAIPACRECFTLHWEGERLTDRPCLGQRHKLVFSAQRKWKAYWLWAQGRSLGAVFTIGFWRGLKHPRVGKIHSDFFFLAQSYKKVAAMKYSENIGSRDTVWMASIHFISHWHREDGCFHLTRILTRQNKTTKPSYSITAWQRSAEIGIVFPNCENLSSLRGVKLQWEVTGKKLGKTSSSSWPNLRLLRSFTHPPSPKFANELWGPSNSKMISFP